MNFKKFLTTNLISRDLVSLQKCTANFMVFPPILNDMFEKYLKCSTLNL